MSRFFSDAWRDWRYAARGFGRAPGSTAVAVLSLALGVGATTAIASAIDSLLFRSLSVERPQELVVVQRRYPGRGVADYVSYPAFERLRDSGVFADVAGSMTAERSVRLEGRTATLTVGLVSGSYFSTLGVRSTRGRVLTASDDSAGSPPVGVLSAACWQREFDGAADVVGKTIAVNDVILSVVGVADPAFVGEDLDQGTDVWIPVAHVARVLPERPGLIQNQSSNWIRAIARLKPGAPVGQAESAVRTIYATLPGPNPAFGQSQVELAPAGRGFTPQREVLATPLAVLVVVAALVLLMASANTAMLLLARGAARRREIATRLALGSGRSRLIRQLLAEGLLLSALAGAAGFIVAIWMTRALSVIAASGRAAFQLPPRPDAEMLAGAAVVSLLTGVTFSILPAFRSTRVSLSSFASAGDPAPGSRRWLTGGRLLVVGQSAASVMLLIGAGLFVQTLWNLEGRDFGFDRDRVLLFWMSPSEAGRQTTDLARDFTEVPLRVTPIAGVTSVSASSDGVLSGFIGLRAVAPVGHPAPAAGEDTNAQWNLVAPGFFRTIGTSLVAGRDFGVEDTAQSTRVAVVNETMARKFFGTERPVGEHFGFGRDLSVPLEIVGVVKDATYFSARDEPTPMVFLPYVQDVPHLYRMCVAVRVSAPSSGLIARIREALAAIDPGVPVRLVTSTADQVKRTLSTERLTAWLGGVFGLAAIALACLGVYGVTAYSVVSRTREIGVRVALGEPRARILGLIVGQSLITAAIGAGIGVAGAMLAAGYARSLLYGVTTTDSATIIGAVAGACLMTVVAALPPAVRAASIDPIVALRTN